MILMKKVLLKMPKTLKNTFMPWCHARNVHARVNAKASFKTAVKLFRYI